MTKPIVAISAQASLLMLAVALTGNVWASIAQHKEPYISYTVQTGDTLQGLSQKLLANPRRWDELARLNGLKNPNLIHPGLVLDVPRSLINFANQPKLAAGGVLQSASGIVTVNGAAAQVGALVPEGARVQTAAGSS
ncbi:MAG: LysM peptidoglycan-binding domain-containing protein, partial [Burkholderiales bacterium]